MKNNSLAEKVAQLEEMLRGQQVLLGTQRAELALLHETLAQKQANRPAPVPLFPSSQVKPPDNTRRRMLKRMGLAVLAGGAALGITAATYAPAKAKITVTASSNFGGVVTRNDATITNFPPNSIFGLFVTPGPSFDVIAEGVLYGGYNEYGIAGGFYLPNPSAVGLYGYTYDGTGAAGFSIMGKGVIGSSGTGNGVTGYSSGGTAVHGENYNAASPAINAVNSDTNSSSGIALQIERGGLTVKGAEINTQTASFTHKTSTNSYISKIDNPFCNNRPNALLFVTHNFNPPATTGVYAPNTFGVYYSGDFWYIFNEDYAPAIPVGTCFNVLIINP